MKQELLVSILCDVVVIFVYSLKLILVATYL